MRVAELCAGYGGLGMALQLAGVPVELVWYAETDEDASKVIATHHPDVPNVGNITIAQFSTQEPVDILLAGWPCQGQSAAGKRLGSADERWLWPDVFRAVRVLQPAVFFGENVPGLFTIEGGALFGGVLADLDEVGYTVRWTTVGACKVRFCHHRHRVFIHATTNTDSWTLADVAYADRWRIYRAAILRHELVFGRAAPDPAEPSAKGGVRLTARFSEWMQGLEDGYVTGHVGRTAALRLLGNGVVPLQGAYGWQLMTRASQEVTT